MSLQITARNVDLSEDLKEYVEKKIGKLNKFVDGTPDVHVILRAEKFRQIAEVTLLLNGVTIHGQTQTNDIFTSLDKVTNKVQRQVVKDKRRAVAIKSRKSQDKKGVLEEAASLEETEENPSSEMIKGGTYSRKPMAPEEALMQIKALGEDFFLFINSQTDEVNLFQRREKGEYWLIEPESD
jgi:putative sigma-54 modulation protein